MTRPNFVLIMTDTQGANMVGCYGRPALQTPNLDRLAGEGIRFDRAYTTNPVCGPARSGLFTGLYPSSNGVFANTLALGQNVRHMGQRFRDLGYRTAYVGKWHLDGLDYFDTGSCPDGWDEQYWYDGRRYLDDLSDSEIHLWRQGLKRVEDLRRHNIRPEFTWGHRCSNRAIRFLQAEHADPFLLVVSYDEPHGPFTCPPEYAERFVDFEYALGPAAQDTLETKPAHQREWAASGEYHRPTGTFSHPLYFGCNSFVDSEIGRVLQAVDRYAPENTYVFYTSDHGDLFGAHRLTSKGPVMYEEITRIPLIVRLPGKRRAATVQTTPVSHADILPTLLDLAGANLPPILHGQSLKPALLDGQVDPERAVLLEFNRFSVINDNYGGFQPIRCLVRGRHKLVLNLLTTDELYDLQTDPAELHNRIEDPAYTDLRDELHGLLLDELDRIADPFRGPCWERRPWATRRTRGWRGPYRHRPADGYLPPARVYNTGKPPTQPVTEKPPTTNH